MISWLLSASLALLGDQLSKHMVLVRAAARGSTPMLPLIRLVRNPRPLERNRRPGFLVAIWIAALGCAAALYFSSSWFHSTVALCGLGLAFGGAAGNLVDLLRFRCVLDFIDLHWWPVFNLADAAIVVGLLLAFWPKG